MSEASIRDADAIVRYLNLDGKGRDAVRGRIGFEERRMEGERKDAERRWRCRK